MQPPRSYIYFKYKKLPNVSYIHCSHKIIIVTYISMLKHKPVYGRSYPAKHRYQTKGVVDGAHKLFDIGSLEMTLNERISVIIASRFFIS